MQIHTKYGGHDTAILTTAVISAASSAVTAAGDLLGGPVGQFLNAIGGPSVVVFWAGILLGWSLRSRRIKRRNKESGESSRTKAKGEATGGGKSPT